MVFSSFGHSFILNFDLLRKDSLAGSGCRDGSLALLVLRPSRRPSNEPSSHPETLGLASVRNVRGASGRRECREMFYARARTFHSAFLCARRRQTAYLVHSLRRLGLLALVVHLVMLTDGWLATWFVCLLPFLPLASVSSATSQLPI